MNDKKRVGDWIEPCETLLLIGLGGEQWSSATAEIEWTERKLEIKVRKEGQNPEENSLENKALRHLIESF